MRNRSLLSHRGSVVTVGLVAVVPLLAAIGAIGIDLMHNNDAIGALQRSTDAGALAGAQTIWSFQGPPKNVSATMTDTSNEDAVNSALKLTSANVADGRAVYTNVVPGATITATLSPANAPTTCTVDATMPVHSFFAMMFGNFGQTIQAHSVAGMGQTIDKMNGGYLPILVGMSQPDPNGRKLSQATSGSQFTVVIKDNSVWIYNPGQVDKEIIQGIADPSINPQVYEQPITIGDYIRSDDGIKSAASAFPGLVGKTVFFPVTMDDVGQGAPNHQVIGFFAIRVQSVSTKNPDPSITGIVTPAIGPGVYTGKGQNPTFMTLPFATQGATIKTARLIE